MQSNPFGLRTITPYLLVDGASDLIKFLQHVFNAVVRGEIHHRDDGTVGHAELTLGDSVVMVGEASPAFAPHPATLYTYVEDCDATVKKAIAAGGKLVLDITDFPHGDRYGGVEDKSGNIWWIVTHIGSVK